MVESPPLTNFHKECERTLVRTIVEFGFDIINRRVFEGEEVIYIQFNVQETEIEIFIYDDEAGLHSPTFSKTYERWDYDSSTDLISACNQQLQKMLAKIDDR